MELLIIIINREEHFEKLVSILVEAGVKGATISDSEGIGHFLAYEVPIFAGLKNLISEGKSANKTIIALLDDHSIFTKLKKLLAEEDIDFTKQGLGVIMTVPVSQAIKSEDEPE